MKLQKIICLLLAILMASALAACGAKPSAPQESSSTVTADGTKALKVGFSLPSMSFPFYARMYDQIESEAKERNWELSFVDGNLDATTQLNGLQDMINNDIDVLVFATWWIDAMTDIMSQCEKKGIPVFVMDNMVIPAGSEKAITLTTGTDNYNAGMVGGIWYANELNKQGKTSLNMVAISSQSEQMVKRYTGFVDGLSKNGIDVHLLNTYDGGKRETAMTMAEDALTALPELELIYGASAQDSLGAYDATIGANRTNVLVIGLDGEDEEIQAVDKGQNYIASITQDPKGQAKLIAANIDKWQAGETFDQIQETPAGIYCAEGQFTGEEILALGKN